VSSNEPALPPPGRTRTLARFAFALVLVACAAASFAIVFRSLLALWFHHAYGHPDVVSAFRSLHWTQKLALPTCGGILAGAVARVTARRGGQGVGDVMEAVAFGRVRLSMRTTLLKSLGSFLALSTGASIGREGPIIQFGASIARRVADLLAIDEQQARVLIAAGTAAGFGAAYNTPLAAVLFVLEVVTGIVALEALLPSIAATVIATTLTRAAVGGGPIYGQRAFNLSSAGELLAHALLGVAAGLGAQLFMRMLSGAEALFERSRIAQPVRAGLGGLFVGSIAIVLPEVTGNGYEPLNALLDGQFGVAMLLTLLLAKAVGTTASVASGSPGGVFTPTLLLGAALGGCYGAGLSHVLGGHVGSTGSYALVGMAAMTAATTHAPIMAAVLVFELSGDYAIVLPLLLATAVATAISRMLRGSSIYMAELKGRGATWELTLEGRRATSKRQSNPPP
jgi:CIC family chloride channel protein